MIRQYGVLRASFFLALAGAACAQVQGPVIGYLPDAGGLRTMAGIPAAGSVGGAITADGAFSRIEVSPNQTQALAVAAGTGAVMLYTMASGASVAVQGVASAPDRIIFSPSGTAAGLWFSKSRHFQLLTTLSASPFVREIDFSFTGLDPTALAVSDDGQWMTGAWPFSLYAVGPDYITKVLPVSGAAEAVCFFHGRNDVAAITPSQVVLIADIAGAVTPNVIWSKPDDLPADPAAAAPVEVAVGFATSFDNRYLSVAGNLGSLSTFDLTAGTSVGLNCACSPANLYGMGGPLFRVTGLIDGVVKVFDASINEVWFVPLAAGPPIAASAANGGAQ
ncbi:MAG: hypothetical protein ABI833_04370 [Acidobacteriota bacterium]